LFIEPVAQTCSEWNRFTVVHAFSVRAFMSGIAPLLVGVPLSATTPAIATMVGSALLCVSLAAAGLSIQYCTIGWFYLVSFTMGIGYGVLYFEMMRHVMAWLPASVAGSVFGASVGLGGIVDTILCGVLLHYLTPSTVCVAPTDLDPVTRCAMLGRLIAGV
jgi:hypothetical protein